MYYHHDSTTYADAAKKVGDETRRKFEAMIAKGRDAMGPALDRVERTVPVDAIVKAKALDFSVRDDGRLLAHYGDTAAPIHSNAMGHLNQETGMGRYLTKLVEGAQWEKELAAHNLRERMKHSDARRLVRNVEGEVRSFLSDKFRRYDDRPIIEAYMIKMMELGGVPVEFTVTDVKVRIRMILPVVFEPIPDEPMLLGTELGNSNHGAGKLLLADFITRTWCTNTATAHDYLKKVHLGSRLTDDIAFSEATMLADTNTVVGMLGDVIGHALLPANVDKMFGAIRKANDAAANFSDYKARLSKLFTKEEIGNAEKLYDSADVTILPPAKSAWRMSNLISHLANLEKDGDRRLMLQAHAGAMAFGGDVIDVPAVEA